MGGGGVVVVAALEGDVRAPSARVVRIDGGHFAFFRCNSAVIRLQNLYVQRIPKSGRTPDEVLDYLGLDSKAIARAVKG